MAFDAFGFEGLPFYYWYELQHAALGPIRAAADATCIYYKNPINPLTHTTIGKSIAAGCEMFERATRRYGKPGLEHPADQDRRRARRYPSPGRVGASLLQVAPPSGRSPTVIGRIRRC